MTCDGIYFLSILNGIACPPHHVWYVADHDWLLAIVPMSLSPARGRMDEVKSLTSRHQTDKALAALRPIGPQTSGQ